MRICRVTPGFAPRDDGWSRHAVLLSEYQRQMGHEVLLIQPYEHETTAFGFEVVCPGEAATEPPGGKLARARFARDTARWVRASSRVFDVLHVHGDAIDVQFLSAEARRRRIPLVLTVHGGLNTRWRYRVIAGPILRRADRVIAVSSGVRDQLMALGLEGGLIRVVSSGVETNRLATPRVARGHDVAIVFVGRLAEVKGLPYLIQGFKKAHLSDASTLTLVGDGPERSRLETEAAGDARIRFEGQRDHDEVVDSLRRSDAFVMPSVDILRQREGTPTALLEAMAAGLACVVTDSGGLPATVEDGRTGLVVPQRDPAALAGALSRLADDPHLRLDLGERAAGSAADRDWAIQARRVVEVYEQAIAAVQDILAHT